MEKQYSKKKFAGKAKRALLTAGIVTGALLCEPSCVFEDWIYRQTYDMFTKADYKMPVETEKNNFAKLSELEIKTG